MYIFGTLTLKWIQVLFITWYPQSQIRVRVSSLSLPTIFLCTSSLSAQSFLASSSWSFFDRCFFPTAPPRVSGHRCRFFLASVTAALRICQELLLQLGCIAIHWVPPSPRYDSPGVVIFVLGSARHYRPRAKIRWVLSSSWWDLLGPAILTPWNQVLPLRPLTLLVDRLDLVFEPAWLTGFHSSEMAARDDWVDCCSWADWHVRSCALSPRVCLITCKWVYKVKTRSDSSLELYKTRLVARGFQQEQGHDYNETFSPVAHITTIHTLLPVGVVHLSAWYEECLS
jgi:hypothetical protein